MRRFLRWLLGLLVWERHDIGRDGDIYLTRWGVLCRRFAPGRKLFLHRFLRSDGDVCHDHPFAFWSLILWPGYWEHTPVEPSGPDDDLYPAATRRRWYGPLSLLRRPATWTHRVELAPGRTCWTLVWTGPKVRSWGFACPRGWVPWREHARRLELTGDGCGPLPPEGGQTA